MTNGINKIHETLIKIQLDNNFKKMFNIQLMLRKNFFRCILNAAINFMKMQLVQ